MSLLDGLNPLVRASRSGDADRFLSLLLKSEVWFVGTPALEGRSPSDLPPEDLASFLEQAAAATQAQEEMKPWALETDGKVSFPFFSSQRLLQEFLRSYVAEVNKIIPFQVGQIHFVRLLPFALSADEAVLNPRTKVARVLSLEERELLEGVATNAASERCE